MTDGDTATAVDGGSQQPVAAQAAAQEAAVAAAAQAADRPEIPVAAAFAGGFVLAVILRRLAR